MKEKILNEVTLLIKRANEVLANLERYKENIDKDNEDKPDDNEELPDSETLHNYYGNISKYLSRHHECLLTIEKNKIIQQGTIIYLHDGNKLYDILSGAKNEN